VSWILSFNCKDKNIKAGATFKAFKGSFKVLTIYFHQRRSVMKYLTMPRLVLCIFLFMCFGCCKHEEVKVNCIDDQLKQKGMAKYQGEEIGCKFFLSLYEYNNKQYFLLGNHCADMVSYPTSCDGKKLCENADDKECKEFFDNATYIGIVGIEK
jgi:hypothetical protein